MKHVDPMGGYLQGMHINWGFLSRGLQFGGCNLWELYPAPITLNP